MANPLYGQNKADNKLDLLKSGKNLGVKVSVPLLSTTVQNTLILTISPTANKLAGILYAAISTASVEFSCSTSVPAEECNFLTTESSNLF